MNKLSLSDDGMELTIHGSKGGTRVTGNDEANQRVVIADRRHEFRGPLEAVAANIVHQIGDALYDALPPDVAHKYFVDARQATNDRVIDFAKELISGYAEKRFGKSSEDDERVRNAIAEVLAKTRGHAQADEIDRTQAVHAVNALTNAGAVITWPVANPT